ncbi:TIGR03757 family integrating conjugative element protein [Xanthomonas campestris pv. phormiicola]|nr:TIGR03757 family integrating conjugative element protein [Xanthomonas campestris pv. phormiicola]UYC17412.1 TIGR03757 family integrating conjugative element protein [Xanthomonas campestris pv. phormiicola]
MLPLPRPAPGPLYVPLVAAGILLAVLPLASATEITVFTDQSVPVRGAAGATVVHLDAARTLETQLAADLPADPNRAQAIAQQRLQQGGDQLQRDLASAYQSVADAWDLGVTTLPAVVVDRRYVVYGEPDVAKAVARIDAYRRTQP